MYSPGLELTTPRSSGRRSNHFAMKDSRFGLSTFLIYRQAKSRKYRGIFEEHSPVKQRQVRKRIGLNK